MFTVVIKEETCINCLICLDTCEKGIFSSRDGVTVEVEDSTFCVGCGECITACPTQSILVEKKRG